MTEYLQIQVYNNIITAGFTVSECIVASPFDLFIIRLTAMLSMNHRSCLLFLAPSFIRLDESQREFFSTQILYDMLSFL